MEMQEDFLVNPPKKRRKAKKAKSAFGGLGGAHRPLVFGPKGGPWKRSHRSKRKLATLQNPFGESLMIAGLNPKRRKRYGVKHRKTSFASLFGRHNPGRRRHYGRRRHNPTMAITRTIGLDKITGNLPQIFAGAVALIAVPAIPRMTGFDNTPLRKYGMETAAVLGGGAVLGFFSQTRKFSGAWVIGGSAGILADLIRQYLIPMIPGLSAFKDFGTYQPGLPAFGPGYQPYSDYGYEPLQGTDDSGLGAFPMGDSGLGAFPGDGGAYDMTGTPFIPVEGTSVY